MNLIDYRMAYNMIPRSWIIDCLKMYNEVIEFIKETLKNWRVELAARGKISAELKIRRGIFQGDTLSTLLFVIAIRVT